MEKVALAVCSSAGDHAPAAQAEMRLLAQRLEDLGVVAAIECWDAPAVQWDQYRAVVICQTWDYIEDFSKFSDWVNRVSATSKLFNEAPVLHWNVHKDIYMKDLIAEGVECVPTLFVGSEGLDGFDWGELKAEVGRRQWGGVVIKPALGCDGEGVARFDCLNEDAVSYIRKLLTTSAEHSIVLIQPFISSVKSLGELSLVYIDGEFTHAVRKRAADGEYRIQERFGGFYEATNPSSAAMQTGDATVAALRKLLPRLLSQPETVNSSLLYTRVDVMCCLDESGRENWVVGEVELVEPFLYFLPFPTDVAVEKSEIDQVSVSGSGREETLGELAAGLLASAIVRRIRQ